MPKTSRSSKIRGEIKETNAVLNDPTPPVSSKKMKATDDSSKSLISQDDANRNSKPLVIQDLCEDVIRIVFDFLGNVRDIYNLARQSKLFFSLLTNEMIIRAAVFQKGLPGTLISRIIQALRDESIYVPSTMRLLRLVNGVRCERLDQCWGYNMNEKTSSKVCSVWMPGVFTCHDCAVGLSAAFNRDGAWASHNDKVLKGCFGWTNKAMIEPFFEKGTGERVGPIVPLLRIKQVSRSFYLSAERLTALSGIIEEESKRDQNANKSARMIDCYTTAIADAEAYEQRREAEIAAKAQARNSERLAILRWMYSMLYDCLGNEPWRDAIMGCEWCEDVGSWKFGVNFHCSIVSRAVEFYEKRPSQINQKAMSRVAMRIKTSMIPLTSTNILTADFLQDVMHPFAFVLYEYISRNVTLPAMLQTLPSSNRKFDRMINLINQGQLKDALIFILHGKELLNKVFAFGVVPDVEQLEIHADMPAPMLELFLPTNFHDLAEHIWMSKTASQRIYNGQILSGSQEMTFIEAKYWWVQCNSIYSTRSRNIVDFFTSPVTMQYIEDTINNVEITDLKIKSFKRLFTSIQYEHLLDSRSFQPLLRMQRNQLRI